MVATAHVPAALVTVTAGRMVIGLDMRRIAGVERADRVRPGQPGTVVNAAGEWPVLSLAEQLGEPPPPARTGQILLLEVAGERLGLLVDRLSQTQRTAADRLGPVPPALAAGPFAGAARLDDGPVLLLDPDRLLGAGDPITPPPVPRVRPMADRRLLVLGQVDGPHGRAVAFGIPADLVIELFDPAPGHPVPWSPPHVRELIAWRERAVPVLDLAVWCGMPTPSIGRRVAVARTPAGTVGLSAGPLARVQPTALPHVPSRRELPLDPARVLGVFDTADRTIVLPDLSRLAGPN